MKKKYILITVLLFIFVKINAQLTTVVGGLYAPFGLAFNGDDLYIAEWGEEKIVKIDITVTNPTLTDVATLTDETSPEGILLNGNDLYIALNDSDKIVKIDITATSPTTTDVVTGLDGPSGLLLIGNDLYISEFEGGRILKIDITATNPTATTVVGGLSSPFGLAFNGNDLYISEYYANKISKIDITVANPTTTDVFVGVNGPSGLAFNGNDLYIAEYNGREISKIDITVANPTLTSVVTGTELYDVTKLVFNGNDLYMTVHAEVLKFTESVVTSQVDINNSSISIFPNPSTNFIQISGLNKTTYKIIDILGAEIKAGRISDTERINIQDLTNGLYFLKFENGSTTKFIKE